MRTAPAYVAQLLELLWGGALRAGEITHFRVEHDDGCAFFSRGVCDCRPEVRVLDAPPPGWKEDP
jgi:hypothetical protein